MPKQYVTSYIEKIKRSLEKIDPEEIGRIVDIINTAYQENKQIFIMGNGGSAASASHFACDLGKGTLRRVYDHEEKRLRVISLTDNVPLLTAFANDLSYEDIFSQQLSSLVNRGDVVIVITGSGNSKNILKAIEVAKRAGAISIGLLGFEGGKAKDILDHKVIIQSNDYGVIEDSHSILCHAISGGFARLKDI